MFSVLYIHRRISKVGKTSASLESMLAIPGGTMSVQIREMGENLLGASMRRLLNFQSSAIVASIEI